MYVLRARYINQLLLTANKKKPDKKQETVANKGLIDR